MSTTPDAELKVAELKGALWEASRSTFLSFDGPRGRIIRVRVTRTMNGFTFQFTERGDIKYLNQAIELVQDAFPSVTEMKVRTPYGPFVTCTYCVKRTDSDGVITYVEVPEQKPFHEYSMTMVFSTTSTSLKVSFNSKDNPLSEDEYITYGCEFIKYVKEQGYVKTKLFPITIEDVTCEEY